jgi:hypothetical protein
MNPAGSEKPRRVSAAHGGNKVKSVTSGDMRGGNDIYHDGCGRAAVMQSLCRKAKSAFPAV